MSRVTLPSGGWAELRDPGRITNRGRNAIQIAAARLSPGARDAMNMPEGPERDARLAEAFTGDDTAAALAATSAAVLALIVDWSFTDTLGRPSIDNIDDLEADDFDTLMKLGSPVAAAAFVDFTPSRDEGSPTGPSNG